MRTIVELEDRQMSALDRLAKRRKQSRAALFRSMVDDYLKSQVEPDDDVFGVWKDRNIDAMDYLEKLRSEW